MRGPQLTTTISEYKNIIKNSILKYLNRKKQYKYYNKADTAMTVIKLMILVCYFLLGSVTS